MQLDNIIIRGLAAWRISHMLVYESGPFDVFIKLRAAQGIQHNSEGLPTVWPSNFRASLLSCVLCLSIWCSFILRLAPSSIINIFAIASVAAILEKFNGES